jgi:hypothetical protein
MPEGPIEYGDQLRNEQTTWLLLDLGLREVKQ